MKRISKWQKEKGVALAFTLIELLAVIAIIGLLSALVVGLSGLAGTKSRQARIRGDHAKLLTDIESYKASIGTYPPDNDDTNKWPEPAVNYYPPDNQSPAKWNDASVQKFYDRVARNPLFYELSGAVYSNGFFTTLNKSETVPATALKNELGVGGIQNSSKQRGEVPFKGTSFKKEQFAELNGADDVEILVIPMKGPFEMDVKIPGAAGKTKRVSPWFYNTTSTNRHNPESFDLWCEYIVGGRTNVVGNWKE